jgi:hypothetical protein
LGDYVAFVGEVEAGVVRDPWLASAVLHFEWFDAASKDVNVFLDSNVIEFICESIGISNEDNFAA